MSGPSREQRPAGNGALYESRRATSHRIQLTAEDTRRVYVENFTRRVVQDALSEGASRYWLRRAAALEDARPRVGDFNGRASREALRTRWQRLTDEAKACRAAAQVALLQDAGCEHHDLVRVDHHDLVRVDHHDLGAAS